MKLGVNRITLTAPASNGLMREHAFFEYRAKPMSTPHIEEQGEPIHYLIKMEIGAGRTREIQEIRDALEAFKAAVEEMTGFKHSGMQAD
jgi:hypothetical protein